MRKSGMIFAAVLMVICGVFLVGCQGQGSSSDKQARLVAVKNKQLQARINELESRLEVKDQQLEQCQSRNSELQGQIDTKIEKNVNEVLAVVLDKNKQLQQENQKLQAEIDRLKGPQ